MSEATNHFTDPSDDPEAINQRSEPKRAQSDAHNRCQWVHPQSQVQCKNQALTNKQKCATHDVQGKNERKQRYNFTLHATGIKELAEDDNFTCMNVEISALRKLLEIYWNQMKDANDFFMHGGKIENIIEKIQRVLTMSKKLEVTLGQMVDKNGFSQYTNEVIAIIGEEIEDKPTLERIGTRIGDAIERAIARSAQAAEERIGS